MSEEIKKKMLMVSAILYKSNVPIEEAKIIGHFIEQLQQENQQLKEQLEKKYETTGTLTNEILYEENTKLLSILDEIREYIEKECCDLLIGYFHTRFDCTEYYDKLLQILDKVKSND